ncbi:MAG: hypothetical protein HGA53_07655 [Anaerolineaceae bacterium]|nr:hypothetical protein [Anaerolineaceae bacterium]
MNKKWILLVGFLMVVALLAAQTSSVMAALRSCRTDPIVYLSDGTIVTLESTIYTDPANIVRVDYTLHAPVGLYAVKVEFPAKKKLMINETFVLISDQLPGNYASKAFVLVKKGTVSVTTYMSFKKGPALELSGVSGDVLLINTTLTDRAVLKMTK